MGSSFEICSCTADRTLRIGGLGDDFFTAELLGAGFAAAIRVYTYTDPEGISRFFGGLASQERPWSGVKAWESLEGEFSIEAFCSSIGHVHFEVCLRGLQGSPEEWTISAGFVNELGQLPTISRNADAFFSGAHT
jgi:hypothetical protein